MAVGKGHPSSENLALGKTSNTKNYFSPEFILVLDSSEVKTMVEVNLPYREEYGRILRVVSGRATYQLNMIDYELEPFSVLMMPPQGLGMIREATPDFAIQAMTLKDLPTEALWQEMKLMRVNNDDWQRISEYFDLMWRVVNKKTFSFTTIHHLQLALLSDLRHINEEVVKNLPAQRPTRQQHIMSEFIRLVNQHAVREHRISFYAEQLFLTPNRLSTIVKEQSGETAQQWINRALVNEAKVLLRHSTLMNYEIAERLNFPNASFFNKYFRKQTGMTPVEYKEK